FRAMAGLVPAQVKAILCISAHWFVAGTFTTGNEQPKTIHDFGGFPDELFAMQYPAPGNVVLARRVVDLIGAARASVRLDWGLDHYLPLLYVMGAADATDKVSFPVTGFDLGSLSMRSIVFG